MHTRMPSGSAPGRDDAMAAALSRAIERFSRASVLVVGDAMLDRYFYGQVTRISPEAPVPVLSVDREVALPGGAGNVVRNLTALGVAVAFVSVVGDDQTGSDLTGLIGGQPGVEPWLLVQGGRKTTLKTRFVALGQQLLRADQEQTDPIHPKLAERLLRIARDAMVATSVTVLSDYGKGVLAGEGATQLVATARQAGRRVVVDPSGGLERFAGADLIMPTSLEITEATGLAAETDAELAAAGAVLRQRHGFGAILVQRGEAGLALCDDEGTRFLPAIPNESYDPSGLADTIIAVLAAGVAVGLAFPLAVHLAHLATGISAAKPGTAVALPDELRAALGSHAAAAR